MNRDDVKALVLAVLIAAFVIIAAATFATADEPKLPAGITCDDVRAKVAELGWVKAVALALERGATFRQIRDAKRCLK